MTERNKPAMLVPSKEPSKNAAGWAHREHALRILDQYSEALTEYIELLDLVINDYLLVVALDSAQDEHLLAFDTPLHIERRPRWQSLRQLRIGNGPYWIQYQTKLPAQLRAYHLVAQTHHGLVIDTMSLSTNADLAIVEGARRDLVSMAARMAKMNGGSDSPLSRSATTLEMEGIAQRISEVIRRRSWEASRANRTLSRRHLRQSFRLLRAAEEGSLSTFPQKALRRIPDELEDLQLERDFTVETEPPTSRAHVYWRRDPSRVDVGRSIDVISNIFIRDTTGYRPRNITSYVLSVVIITYVLACLRFNSIWPFNTLFNFDLAAEETQGIPAVPPEGIIAVLLLVPGFLYTRLHLPPPDSIAGQVRKVPRLVAYVTIAMAALTAAAVATTANPAILEIAFAGGVFVPLLAVAFMYLGSRAVLREHLPVTTDLPMWIRRASTSGPPPRQFLLRLWRWHRTLRVPDTKFSTQDDKGNSEDGQK